MEYLREIWQKIVNLLKSLTELPMENKKMIKVVIIVGHTEEKGGAINYLGESEFSFNSRIADQVKLRVNEKYKSLIEVTVLKRHFGTFATLQPDIRIFKPDVSIELHFNSFSKKAYGCEALVYRYSQRSNDNIRLADLITDRMSAVYGFRERHVYILDNNSEADGVKVLSEGRGVGNLKAVHECAVPFAMILEPCFANFETPESKAIFEDEETYIDFLVNAIGEDVRKAV